MKLRRELCIVALTFTLLSGCGGSTPSVLHSVGSIVPSATLAGNSIAVSGNYAYLTLQGASGAIAVLNIAGDTPTLLTTFALPCSTPNGIKISGSVLYVTCYDNSALYILSVNNAVPSAPVFTITGSVLGLQNPFPGIALSGTELYVPSHAGFIFRVNVSNPSAPGIDGSVATATGTSPNAVFVANNIVYCACSSEPTQSWFQTFNATGTMTLLGQTPLAHSPQRLIVKGNYAYVTNFDAMRLDIVDITNPAAPSILSSVALPCFALPIALNGNTAYVGCYQSTHGIATNPAAPAILGYLVTTASLDVQDLLFTGGALYALSGDPNGNFNILSF
jgi:hypothetical protein